MRASVLTFIKALENKKERDRNIFDKIMAEKFPKLRKETYAGTRSI